MIKTKIQHITNYIVKLFESQGLTRKKVLSLVFWMLMPFMEMKTSDSWHKYRQYGYKILADPPFKGCELLSYVSINRLIEYFQVWLKKSPSRKSENPLDLIFDFTKTGKKFGSNIPLLHLLYDYVNGLNILTHQFGALTISLGELQLVVDFMLWDPDDRKGYNQIAQELIERLLDALSCYGDGSLREECLRRVHLVMDGSFGNGEMLAWVKRKGFKFFVVKSGGNDLVDFQWCGRWYHRSLKDLEGFLIRSKYTTWKPFSPHYNLPGVYTFIKATLVSQNIEIKVLLIRLKHGYLMLLTLDTELQANRMFKAYKRRWPIETMFEHVSRNVAWSVIIFIVQRQKT